MSSAKRSLFQTPTRSSKRTRRTTKSQSALAISKRNARILRALRPETKQYRAFSLTNGFTNYAESAPSTSITQGTGDNQFIGNKFRISRLRVYYDFSQLTLTSGVRVVVYMPKASATSALPIASTTTPISTIDHTVLYDMLLPDAPETATGSFDVTGPINVETNAGGSAVWRNDLRIVVWSSGNGVALKDAFSYTFWYTDA